MLSNNPHVQFWINQFNYEDRRLAKCFLDEFEYISTDKFISEIENLLIELISGTKDNVAILPIRELLNKEECYYPSGIDDVKYYIDYKEADLESKSLRYLKQKGVRKTLTKNEIEKFNPILLNPLSMPGSESIIANIVTQLKRRYRSRIITGKYDRNPSIDDLRKNKCRHLILVDDVIGSGDRLFDFILSISKNTTINSWISGGILKLSVVSYMKSKQSEKYLKKLKQKFKCIYAYQFPTFYELEESERETYTYLVNKYSNKNEKNPLGYKETFGKAIFGHSIPNNTPPIIWRYVKKWKPLGGGVKHIGEWQAIFPSRSMPDLIKHSINENVIENQQNRAKIRVVLTIFKDEIGINTARQLARRLGWNTSMSNDVISKLQIYGLLDKKLKITDMGLRELNYLESVSKHIEFNKDKYYPIRVMGGASAHTA